MGLRVCLSVWLGGGFVFVGWFYAIGWALGGVWIGFLSCLKCFFSLCGGLVLL